MLGRHARDVKQEYMHLLVFLMVIVKAALRLGFKKAVGAVRALRNRRKMVRERRIKCFSPFRDWI